MTSLFQKLLKKQKSRWPFFVEQLLRTPMTEKKIFPPFFFLSTSSLLLNKKELR
jgi:hypothetical protein